VSDVNAQSLGGSTALMLPLQLKTWCSYLFAAAWRRWQ